MRGASAVEGARPIAIDQTAEQLERAAWHALAGEGADCNVLKRLADERRAVTADGTEAEVCRRSGGNVLLRLGDAGRQASKAAACSRTFQDRRLGDWFVTARLRRRPRSGVRRDRADDRRACRCRAWWPGGVHTAGRLSASARGRLRSPTFTIESRYILFRVAGRADAFNLIIDGFQQIRDPIYGGLTFGVNHGDKLALARA